MSNVPREPRVLDPHAMRQSRRELTLPVLPQDADVYQIEVGPVLEMLFLLAPFNLVARRQRAFERLLVAFHHRRADLVEVEHAESVCRDRTPRAGADPPSPGILLTDDDPQDGRAADVID